VKIVRIKTWHWLVAALALAVALDWFIQHPDGHTRELNRAIESKASAQLKSYPYPFRVLRVESGTAVMATPRNFDVPAFRALGALFPDLDVKDTHSPAYMAAQQTLATVQTEARTIVLSQPGIASIRWELDKAWLGAHGIDVPAK
jgi:hypothetical protein